ncbi:MAG: ABC transporter permease [Alphaproteobacteria bacterium]
MSAIAETGQRAVVAPRVGRAGSASQLVLRLYTGAFLLFMFAPLLLLIVASFNDISPPSVTDWHGITGKWYEFYWMNEAGLRADPVLRSIDRGRFYDCFGNSLVVAAFVVPLSLLLGLSGAILLTRWQSRFNSLLWWVLLSPMLAPGIVLGLSTLAFWGQLGMNAGLGTIVLAQTTFIAGYPMLVIMARLQRQPPEHEEAALDLGASPWLAFRRVTLPFLLPALATAGVIAFMSSFENYNTTMFAKGGSCTFSTEIGAMVRNPNGHPPVINAVGAVIVVLTIGAAVAHTVLLRREKGKAGQ